MEDNNFTLINHPDCATRISQHFRQGDTTTDLTWTNKPKSIAWELGADKWGSDHFPIFLRLRGHARQSVKYATSVVYWDRFRDTLEATLVDTLYDEPDETRLEQLLQTINKAKRLATRQFYVTEGSPAPDVHLANLWSQNAWMHCANTGSKGNRLGSAFASTLQWLRHAIMRLSLPWRGGETYACVLMVL
ncbi:hypothetical protein HPB48_015436 [Haemaphysalis longicornis]|uniref:Endonuclease/exonuclease/phosphatase domain-containing protein n=1 Tax=Haemaphysalis longicornis TaxID=44386 RepID=A0A9J6GIZ4_HAELO|nr:hypothetical protein HPB48_015436 [Haemaphysalis longicornis]